jgi:hypothetical protein
MNFLNASTLGPSKAERAMLPPLVEAEEPSIKPKITTTGSATELKGSTALFEKMMHADDPALEAEDAHSSNQPGTEFPVGSDMPRARPPSTRAATTGLVTQVEVSRAGFIFEDSNVRYLSRAELEKLPPEQLRIARHEILARKGRFFKDAKLSLHFRKFSWYRPSVWRVRLNAIEQANVSLIWSIETSSNHSHGPEIAQQNQY